MCFGCSKEPSHRDGSFEYPQHMFWLRNTIKKFQLRTLIMGPVMMIVIIFQCGLNHQHIRYIGNYCNFVTIMKIVFIAFATNCDVKLITLN